MKYAIYSLPLWASILALLGGLPVLAQPLPDPRPGPNPLEPLPQLPPAPEAPVQLEEDIPPPVPLDPEAIPPISFFVDDIQVVGNTIFEAEIEALVQPLEGREITLEDLLTLRTAITQLYVDNGYLTSGAFVPTNQDIDSRTAQIQVVEGQIEQIQINGLGHLREGYVRDRITRTTAPPLNVRRLEEGLQLLQVDPLLDSVNAELTAGSGPGQNILILDLAEADPFFVDFIVDNSRAPSIGTWQGGVLATHLNLLGFGDSLSLGYDFTEGLDLYEARYAVPLNGLDGSLQVRYENAESRIITPQFLDAGIRNENETFSLSFRQPLNRSLTNQFALGLGFDLRESRSFILNDIPFSFSVGPEDGVARVSALRFFQEWVNRDTNTVLAARSQFNLGLGLFNATVNDTGTDGRFFSWLGQFQWVEQFAPGTLLVTRVNAQLTPDSLLPLERFSVGGFDTVRGYAQNQVVTDNAVTASTELRVNIASDLQLVPFLDAGGGWNNQTENPPQGFLLGTGLGLRWQPTDAFSLRIDYGIPLISVRKDGTSLQENGLYFSVAVRPF
ncbi:MAG: ShlB/FhaC/HecB family hemolysin secretion/activation protein [Nodosilinea sp.]